MLCRFHPVTPPAALVLIISTDQQMIATDDFHTCHYHGMKIAPVCASHKKTILVSLPRHSAETAARAANLKVSDVPKALLKQGSAAFHCAGRQAINAAVSRFA